jgi:hypothetical protein
MPRRFANRVEKSQHMPFKVNVEARIVTAMNIAARRLRESVENKIFEAEYWLALRNTREQYWSQNVIQSFGISFE